MAFSVHRAVGVNLADFRRGVVFLSSAEDGEVDAEKVFLALNAKEQNRMKGKFEWWMQGNDGPSHWFHGFTDEDRKYCFVFKRRERRTHHRFYGFLANPQPNTDPQYRLCVLTNHAQKNTEATDPRETDFAESLRVRADVIAAIGQSFPDV